MQTILSAAEASGVGRIESVAGQEAAGGGEINGISVVATNLHSTGTNSAGRYYSRRWHTLLRAH